MNIFIDFIFCLCDHNMRICVQTNFTKGFDTDGNMLVEIDKRELMRIPTGMIIRKESLFMNFRKQFQKHCLFLFFAVFLQSITF